MASGPLLAQSAPFSGPDGMSSSGTPLNLLPGGAPAPAPRASVQPPVAAQPASAADGNENRADSGGGPQMSMAASQPGAGDPLPEMQIDKRPGENGPGTKD